MGAKPRRSVVSTPEQRLPFAIGGHSVPAGTSARIELPVARLPVGTWLSLPVEIVHGLHEGPTIWLSAALHGDELNGIPIIRRTLRSFDATMLRGTIVAVPVVNVFGLVNESRYLPDRRDLNRSFPGSARASLASQLAHLFMTEVVSKCELGIDYHTGSGGRCNLPQIRCDLEDRKTRAAAHHFGAPVMIHSKLRDGSLRSAACDLGIRVLLYEAGEASRFHRESIQAGVDGTLRVMKHLGMLKSSPQFRGPKPVSIQKTRWVRASQSGFLEMAVELGTEVDTGAILGRVYSALDSKDVVLRAAHPGIVIGNLTSALVHRGDAVVHLAML